VRHWNEASALTLVETSGVPDIDIMFAAGDHGDGEQNAFDGPGTSLC